MIKAIIVFSGKIPLLSGGVQPVPTLGKVIIVIILPRARDRLGNPVKPLQTGQSSKAIKKIIVFSGKIPAVSEGVRFLHHLPAAAPPPSS